MSSRSDVVIIGLGYVGLPLAHAAIEAGVSVVGLDLSSTVVEGLMAGQSHIDDLSDADVAGMLAKGFVATSDVAVIADTAAVVVCVPTPLDDSSAPDLGAVRSAATTVGHHVRPGTLIVLESTTYPGTTEEVVQPLVESGGLSVGVDLHLAYSPERVDPGNAVYGIRNTPKVVGGVDEASTERAVELYSRFVDQVVAVSGTREAEMAKLLENTYRHVNIALVNEMVVFCHDLGIDLWESIRAASTKPFGFQAFTPGPGVGGHCIPIDPNYLSYKVRMLGYPFRFVELAQEISSRMPAYVVSRAIRSLNEQERSVKGSRVMIVGVTYKADIADERESPSLPVAMRLRELGAELTYHDPFVPEWRVGGEALASLDDPVAAASNSDLVIFLQHHRRVDNTAICASAPLVFDTRGVLSGDNVEKL